MKNMFTHSLGACSQRGVSLVEMMVALVLSLVLVAGVGQIYLGSKQTYRMQDGQSRLQENIRYAMDMLNRDLRSAGHMGCQSSCSVRVNSSGLCPERFDRIGICCQAWPVVIANTPLPTAVIKPATTTTGGDNNTTGTWPSGTTTPTVSDTLSTVVAGTDAITVMFGESCGGVTTTSTNTVNPADAHLPAGNSCNGGTAGTPLVIADCNNAHVFKAASSAGDVGLNVAQTFLTSRGGAIDYKPNSEIMLFRSYTYYIRFNAVGEPALYQFDNNSASGGDNPRELVEGIENMQIEYGLDTDNDGSANQYVTATTLDLTTGLPLTINWAQVVSVRVTLTAHSVGENGDNLSDTPHTYPFNGATKTAKPLWKSFTTTISLRNRMG